MAVKGFNCGQLPRNVTTPSCAYVVDLIYATKPNYKDLSRSYQRLLSKEIFIHTQSCIDQRKAVSNNSILMEGQSFEISRSADISVQLLLQRMIAWVMPDNSVFGSKEGRDYIVSSKLCFLLSCT